MKVSKDQHLKAERKFLSAAVTESFSSFFCSLWRQPSLSALFSGLFHDCHHFGSLGWQSFKTAITSAVFHDSLWWRSSLRQSSMTVFQGGHHFYSLWFHFFMAAITSEVFDDSLWWQPLMTAMTSTVFDDSAFLARTLRSRVREKGVEKQKHILGRPWLI